VGGEKLLEMILAQFVSSDFTAFCGWMEPCTLVLAVESILFETNERYLREILCAHPLFFYISLCGAQHCFFMNFERTLERLFPSWIRAHKQMTITKNISKPTDGEAWKKVKKLLNIPDVLTFDVLGYFLYTLHLESMTGWINEYAVEALKFLVKKGFVPIDADGVVPPIHALLYNVLQNFETVDWWSELGHGSRQSWSKFIYECLLLLKGTIFIIYHFFILYYFCTIFF
jgi:hypothetical protein